MMLGAGFPLTPVNDTITLRDRHTISYSAAGPLPHLEINPMVLSAMIAAFFLHEATAMWDVSYAVTAREVTPIEQHVHSFLEIVPLMAVAFVSLLHCPQLQALAGLRIERPTPFQWKREPLSSVYALTTVGAMLTLELLPYVEEALRDWHAHPGRLVPPSAHAA